jgi:hypothetical protein
MLEKVFQVRPFQRQVTEWHTTLTALTVDTKCADRQALQERARHPLGTHESKNSIFLTRVGHDN